MKAPTTAGKPPATAPVAPSSARPGVDHATEIGMREIRLSRMAAKPLVSPTKRRAEMICASVAPTAASPLMRIATELV